MSRYFLDTEFIEDFHKPLFRKKRHFIDLVSIGIVTEDGRAYYAISKDFDLKKVWNKWHPKKVDVGGDVRNIYPEGYYIKKDYWLRENVLKPIFYELSGKNINFHDIDKFFTYNNFQKLIKRHGKSNKQIAEEIIQFVYNDVYKNFVGSEKEFHSRTKEYGWNTDTTIEFYGYYADYDWVLFCSLFGRMIDLPKGFPMYCKDLKQMLDDAIMREAIGVDSALKNGVYPVPDNYRKPISVLFDEMLTKYKELNNYPKQENEHSALHDARWNKELYEFLNTI